MSQTQSRLARLFAMLSLLTLGACATMTDIAGIEPAPVSAACLSFHPIRWSSQDTDQTILEVKEHNAVWRALCGETQ